MMKEDAHTKAIPAAVIQAAEDALEAQLQALAPYATPLTPEERKSMLKLGPKTFLFVETAHTLAHENPGLTSKSFDMAAFDVDFADAHGLTGLLNKAEQFFELVDDINKTAGSGSHRFSLEFYGDVKSAAARDVPDARAVDEKLKSLYPSHRRRSHASGDSSDETR